MLVLATSPVYGNKRKRHKHHAEKHNDVVVIANSTSAAFAEKPKHKRHKKEKKTKEGQKTVDDETFTESTSTVISTAASAEATLEKPKHKRHHKKKKKREKEGKRHNPKTSDGEEKSLQMSLSLSINNISMVSPGSKSSKGALLQSQSMSMNNNAHALGPGSKSSKSTLLQSHSMSMNSNIQTLGPGSKSSKSTLLQSHSMSMNSNTLSPGSKSSKSTAFSYPMPESNSVKSEMAHSAAGSKAMKIMDEQSTERKLLRYATGRLR